MLKHNQQLLCLQVEQILVEQELVIKSLGDTLTLPSYIQGYSVLGNGALTLVIDLMALPSQPQKTSQTVHPLLKTLSGEPQKSERSPMTTVAQQKDLSINPEKPSLLGHSVSVLPAFLTNSAIAKLQTIM